MADAIPAEIEVEAAVIASEAASSTAGQLLAERFPSARSVPHEELEQLMRQVRFVVRTGDTTQHANVILRCGVPF